MVEGIYQLEHRVEIKATNDFEKDFLKLMNNSVFGEHRESC